MTSIAAELRTLRCSNYHSSSLIRCCPSNSLHFPFKPQRSTNQTLCHYRYYAVIFHDASCYNRRTARTCLNMFCLSPHKKLGWTGKDLILSRDMDIELLLKFYFHSKIRLLGCLYTSSERDRTRTSEHSFVHWPLCFHFLPVEVKACFVYRRVV